MYYLFWPAGRIAAILFVILYKRFDGIKYILATQQAFSSVSILKKRVCIYFAYSKISFFVLLFSLS